MVCVRWVESAVQVVASRLVNELLAGLAWHVAALVLFVLVHRILHALHNGQYAQRIYAMCLMRLTYRPSIAPHQHRNMLKLWATRSIRLTLPLIRL